MPVFQRYGIRRKLVIGIVGVLVVLLGGLGIWTVSYVNRQTRQRLYSDAQGLVDVGANRITGFFSERGRIVSTFAENPEFQQANHGRRPQRSLRVVFPELDR